MKRVPFLLAMAVAAIAAAQTTRTQIIPSVREIPYAEAKTALDTLRDELLPAELRAKTSVQREAAWPDWVRRRDAEIRARLAQGDEDSLVNLVLFGSSFTTQTRATSSQLEKLGGPSSVRAAELVRGRIEDLVAGLGSPGTNDRLQFARQVVDRKGINPTTPAGKAQTRQFIIDIMTRVGRESDAYDRVAQSPPIADPGLRLTGLSTIFRERGLSSDTSIFPNFAIDQALETIALKGLLEKGSVRRLAIVGPGLDFVDKATGYDFYPQQTIQPFAVVDTLRRLGLAATADFRVTTFDLSPRVNQHLEAARQRARAGSAYVLQLPRDLDDPWDPALLKYWERFGGLIGKEVKALPTPPGAGRVEVRAVRVQPAVVLSTFPRDLNVVLQRLDPLPSNERFDLVIATNILVYYDLFEQSLALMNVSHMLRPGGLFLTNDKVVILPTIPMNAVGYSGVVYTTGSNGSQVDWYQKVAR